MKVKLKGKTRHGKNRVNQHGEWWVVSGETDKSFWLESIVCDCTTCVKWGQDGRWVWKKNDDNFDIVNMMKGDKLVFSIK
tara:strand:+ start:261 stop:500 length:240 start_codon:yes stop_codon:yes gene_type:complete